MREPTTGARAWLTLTKPGVVVLLQVTALCAVLCHDMLAAGGFSGMNWGDSAQTMAVVFVGGYLTAGGANSINMWYDRDIDPIMTRTANRPIPTGEISANAALAFGVLISVAGVAWFVQFGNEVAAFWAAFSILFYVFVYSMWLKRSSVQNIVIGGAAGAFPPMIGWAAVTGTVSFESILIFALVFMWTPPHFWALALYRVEDYRKSGLPMLPVTHGSEFTRLQILLYTIVLGAACLLPFMVGMSGWLYLVAAVVLSIGFVGYAIALMRAYSDALARQTFRFSLIHLSVLFAALLLDHYVSI